MTSSFLIFALFRCAPLVLVRRYPLGCFVLLVIADGWDAALLGFDPRHGSVYPILDKSIDLVVMGIVGYSYLDKMVNFRSWFLLTMAARAIATLSFARSCDAATWLATPNFPEALSLAVCLHLDPATARYFAGKPLARTVLKCCSLKMAQEIYLFLPHPWVSGWFLGRLECGCMHVFPQHTLCVDMLAFSVFSMCS